MPRESIADYAATYTRTPVESLFISPEKFYPLLQQAVKVTAGKTPVDELDTSRLDDAEACRRFRAAAAAGNIVLIRCSRVFPSKLRHTIYVFYKDEAILKEDGCTHTGQGAAAGFGVILWMTPEAYMTMNESQRQHFMRVARYCFYFPKNPNVRENPADLTAEQNTLRGNAFATLKAIRSDAERRSVLLRTFPPQTNAGFDGFDEPMEKLIEQAARDGHPGMQSFLVSVYAEHQDYYLIHRCFHHGFQPNRTSIDAAANAVVSASYIGGQRQPYWDAMADLSFHPQVREFMTTILKDHARRVIEAENVLYVLEKVCVWPELASVLQEISRTAKEPEVRFKATRLLKACASASQAPAQKPGSVSKSFWASLGALLGGGSSQHTPDNQSGDSAEFYRLGREQIGSQIDPELDRELLRLAVFQARIMDDPDVTPYCKSVHTFGRAVRDLMRLRTVEKAVEHNHLMSVARDSDCARTLRQSLKSID